MASVTSFHPSKPRVAATLHGMRVRGTYPCGDGWSGCFLQGPFINEGSVLPSDYAPVDTGNPVCVPASCPSPGELRRRCTLRASTFADRRNCHDVGAWRQCQNCCGDVGPAFTIVDRRFSEILRANGIREPRISTKRKHLQDVSIDCGCMVARRYEHRGARQSHRCHCNATSRGDGRGTCVVARHCRKRITAHQHIVPREAVGTARIASQQSASGIEIHSRDRAVDVTGRGAQRD